MRATEAEVDRRFTSGLLVTTAYTWGRGMGYQTGDDGGPLFYINFRRNYARARFSPRPKHVRAIRKYTYETSLEYDTDNQNALESRYAGALYE